MSSGWIDVEKKRPRVGRQIIASTSDNKVVLLKARIKMDGINAWMYAPVPYAKREEIPTNLYNKCGSCKNFKLIEKRTYFGYTGGECPYSKNIVQRTRYACKKHYELDEEVRFKGCVIDKGE